MLYTENDYNEAEVVASLMKTIDEMDEIPTHVYMRLRELVKPFLS